MADTPIEIYEKAVIRYEVVCDTHGLIGDYGDKDEARDIGYAHLRLIDHDREL